MTLLLASQTLNKPSHDMAVIVFGSTGAEESMFALLVRRDGDQEEYARGLGVVYPCTLSQDPMSRRNQERSEQRDGRA